MSEQSPEKQEGAGCGFLALLVIVAAIGGSTYAAFHYRGIAQAEAREAVASAEQREESRQELEELAAAHEEVKLELADEQVLVEEQAHQLEELRREVAEASQSAVGTEADTEANSAQVAAAPEVTKPPDAPDPEEIEATITPVAVSRSNLGAFQVLDAAVASDGGNYTVAADIMNTGLSVESATFEVAIIANGAVVAESMSFASFGFGEFDSGESEVVVFATDVPYELGADGVDISVLWVNDKR